MDNEAEKAALPGRVESEFAIGSWQSAEAAYSSVRDRRVVAPRPPGLS